MIDVPANRGCPRGLQETSRALPTLHAERPRPPPSRVDTRVTLGGFCGAPSGQMTQHVIKVGPFHRVKGPLPRLLVETGLSGQRDDGFELPQGSPVAPWQRIKRWSPARHGGPSGRRCLPQSLPSCRGQRRDFVTWPFADRPDQPENHENARLQGLQALAIPGFNGYESGNRHWRYWAPTSAQTSRAR